VTGQAGHGPELAWASEAASAYVVHRQQCLDQVRSAPDAPGPNSTARAVVERVHADVDLGAVAGRPSCRCGRSSPALRGESAG
jgi:hypothetical protein